MENTADGVDEGQATSGLREVPAHVPAELVRPFDHINDPQMGVDPFGYFDALRSEWRAFYSPTYEGFWVLTEYEDVHAALQRHELFSNFPTALPARENGEFLPGVRALPISLDPPAHTRYRQLLNQPFSPGRINALKDDVRRLSTQLIDEVIDDGQCDFVHNVARQLPPKVFVKMLGLPLAEWETFAEWAEGGHYAGEEIVSYLSGVVKAREKVRQDDLISVLIDAEVEGTRLTEDEVLAFACLLFTAGLGTTMAALGWMFKFLGEHPGHRDHLVADPALVPTAVEELFRYNSFVQVARTARDDFEFAGVSMRKGDRVLMLLGAADRDPKEFQDPLVVDFQRMPNRHLVFAAGPHRCVGSHLARLEIQTMMQEFHRRIPTYRVAPDATVTSHGYLVCGVNQLPLVWN